MFNTIFRIFMKITGVDRKILGNPGVCQAIKDTAKAGSDFNLTINKLEKITGTDYSDIKFKHNKYNEKNNS